MIKSVRVLSACWSAFLIPFLFLPYRYLWIPAGTAACIFVLPGRLAWRETLRRHGTLVIGTIVLLFVREGLDPLWWGPWFVFVAIVWWLRGARRMGQLSRAGIAMTLWIATIVLLGRPDLARPFPSERISTSAVVVCAGDSLTSGVDIRSDDQTYVAELRRRLPCRVVNAGRANDKTVELLSRIQTDVLRETPSVVVVFIGGNDYLDGTPRAEFAKALESVVGEITALGARVVLVEVPTGIVWNPYAGVFRHVASRYGAILVPESMLRLWFSVELLARDHLAESLTIDGIHLSPSGARRVANWLEPYVRDALQSR